ncbi:hypothetical protein GCM10025857_14800 [Alicyclobacillus contaminans]|uniref:hypothetical protein n=1 Tax=Alicyclobacillus contaminans TaxID=392016 RepID=UPI000417AB0D|nr:hypothetical protein [Alicyclobacillus contaminans]GMA50123.1 hypothetical protein GCM10025857_14800 [Alicyclobacillus contaminans]
MEDDMKLSEDDLRLCLEALHGFGQSVQKAIEAARLWGEQYQAMMRRVEGQE